MKRTPAQFTKKFPDGREIVTEGTYEVEWEPGILVLSDPRDQEFKRIGIDHQTTVRIPIPLIIEDPMLRLPCGHLAPHPGLGGRVVRCDCGKVWRVYVRNGETCVEAQGDWRKNVDTVPGTDYSDGLGSLPEAPPEAEEVPAGSDGGSGADRR